MSPEIAEAVRVLRAGGLVAFPTETVYGLGADARNVAAVARVFRAKGRPADHPLIVHVEDAAAAGAWARELPDEARALMTRFWPGPLTLIVEKADDVPTEVTGGQSTVGLRVPDHPLALALLRAFGGGLAAPSANRFGAVSPTTAAHVAIELGERVDLILDGGPCRVGVESTIVDLSTGRARILRPGGVPVEDVEQTLGTSVPVVVSDVRAPGTHPSHYAPRADLVAVDARDVDATVAGHRALGRRVVVLGRAAPGTTDVVELPEDPEGMARRLYAALREVDARGFEVAVVALPTEGGLSRAVADRIRRAASPRTPD